MTEDDARRAAMDGDWETVARYVVRKGLASTLRPRLWVCNAKGVFHFRRVGERYTTTYVLTDGSAAELSV